MAPSDVSEKLLSGTLGKNETKTKNIWSKSIEMFAKCGNVS